ncbi:MAG: SDR family NAD(P)-dependent oxidoreductase [Myxococcota bacterium]|nr:SDR family NAD(P)-dependent oxidoreductase [Myxococcota bacterium]
MDPFEGRVAVITGGAGGIGFAMAQAFAARGARIALADVDEPGMAARARELEAAGTEVLCVPTDVTRRESVTALADRVYDQFGAAHLVCNNAGIALGGPLLEATPEDWRLTMDIDFWGVVYGVDAFAPRMVERGEGGHVINTASMAGLVGMQWLGVYCAAKFAVVGLTESLRRELAPHGIGVSVLCPMIVATGINENSARARGHEPPPSDATPPPMAGGVIQPEEVGRRVVQAVERNAPYILTHPEQREILRRRAARLDAVFDRESWSP